MQGLKNQSVTEPLLWFGHIRVYFMTGLLSQMYGREDGFRFHACTSTRTGNSTWNVLPGSASSS